MSLKHFFKPDKNFGKDAKELIPQLIFWIIVCGLAVGAFIFIYPFLYRIYTILPPISIHIAIGIILAYGIMFFLRLFFGDNTKENINEIKTLLEKQNVYGVYTFKDIIEEIRNLEKLLEKQNEILERQIDILAE